MKKYIVLALLPIAFGNALICKDKYADLDAILMSEFRAAQKTMNSSTKLELEAILHALVSFAKKAKINRQVAIDKILAIKAALQVCKAEQYKTSWDTVCSYFSVNPEIVTKQIDPALVKVNKALDDLKVTSSEYRFAVAALKVLGVASLIALVGGTVIYRLSEAHLHEMYVQMEREDEEARQRPRRFVFLQPSSGEEVWNFEVAPSTGEIVVEIPSGVFGRRNSEDSAGSSTTATSTQVDSV